MQVVLPHLRQTLRLLRPRPGMKLPHGLNVAQMRPPRACLYFRVGMAGSLAIPNKE
jgi:hypothetical protein